MTNQPAYPLNELETSIVDNPPLRWLQQALRALADLHTFPVATALGATAWQRRWWECFLLPMHVICLRSICPPIYNNNNGQRPRDFNEALPERVSERRAATEMAAMQQWLVYLLKASAVMRLRLLSTYIDISCWVHDGMDLCTVCVYDTMCTSASAY